MSARFSLPPLEYSFDSLEPYIDAKTMQIHHDKHHGAYVDNLNKALETFPDLQGKTLFELLSNLDSVPEEIRTKVRNNGGGHANHTFFWKLLSFSQTEPSNELLSDIKRDFGSLESFKEKFEEAALARFGSGWVWLIKDGSKLEIMSTPNQDTPWMEGKNAILGLDVWEHAYYLKYQNKRADYVKAWWNVVNWKKVSENYTESK